MQVLGPEFRSPEPTSKTGCDVLVLRSQGTGSLARQPSQSELSSERACLKESKLESIDGDMSVSDRHT